uniref:Uncharacterized protein n=1 Tax=Anguilla anguilla TaxID=7936 RepID=A0A0E9TKW0_ANGAN
MLINFQSLLAKDVFQSEILTALLGFILYLIFEIIHFNDSY